MTVIALGAGYAETCKSGSGGGSAETAGESQYGAAGSTSHLYGPYVDTVGRNKKAIKAYIANQLQEDQIADQISLKEFVDPFTGSKNTKA